MDLGSSSLMGSGQANTEKDVEVVSWLLLFYFLDWGESCQFGARDSGLTYIEAHQLISSIMNHPQNISSDHITLIRALRRGLKLRRMTGIIEPKGIEHVILSKKSHLQLFLVNTIAADLFL